VAGLGSTLGGTGDRGSGQTVDPGDRRQPDDGRDLKSSGTDVWIRLTCGGAWKSVKFFDGATDSWLAIRPAWRSYYTDRQWDSSHEAYITYSCSGTSTTVAFRYLGTISGGPGPV
jgi:hypothetical protein